MEIIENGHLYYEAMKNVEGFDFTKMSFVGIFKKMKNILAEAFDNVTTFDIRSSEQIEIITCESGYVVEKDYKTYPALILCLQVSDWDAGKNCKDVWRRARFELKLSPFKCCLDKHNETTGVYSGYDGRAHV